MTDDKHVTQLGFFERGERRALARREDPATSHEAAEAIAGRLPTLQQEVLALVIRHPRRTCSELADLGGYRDPRKVGRRLPELEALGMVKRLPKRACAVTKTPAAVWEEISDDVDPGS